MAKVDCEINGFACSVEDGVWTCAEDPKFEEMLNEFEKHLSERRVDVDPNQDAAAARHMIKEMGNGKIVSSPPPLKVDEATADRVY
jgi:hypothetical protein